jgi:transposase-like protein
MSPFNQQRACLPKMMVVLCLPLVLLGTTSFRPAEFHYVRPPASECVAIVGALVFGVGPSWVWYENDTVVSIPCSPEAVVVVEAAAKYDCFFFRNQPFHRDAQAYVPLHGSISEDFIRFEVKRVYALHQFEIRHPCHDNYDMAADIESVHLALADDICTEDAAWPIREERESADSLIVALCDSIGDKKLSCSQSGSIERSVRASDGGIGALLGCLGGSPCDEIASHTEYYKQGRIEGDSTISGKLPLFYYRLPLFVGPFFVPVLLLLALSFCLLSIIFADRAMQRNGLAFAWDMLVSVVFMGIAHICGITAVSLYDLHWSITRNVDKSPTILIDKREGLKYSRYMSKSTISTYQLMQAIPDQETARLLLESRLWPSGPVCPTCTKAEQITTRKRAGFYRCNACKVDFTVRTGTIFERSHVPLHKWVYAMYLLLTARKGISSMQLAKEIGITQKSAWFVLQRLREACGGNADMLRGIVEVDETYIGGKAGNMHKSKRESVRMATDSKSLQGGGGKSIVVGMRERGGRTKAMHVESGSTSSLSEAIIDNVETGSVLHTDDSRVYDNVTALGYDHEAVNHKAKEYVRGDVTTNSIESVWAVLKRGLHGVYHHASAKHLGRYVDEFTFRLNEGNVKVHTLERLDSFIDAVSGKRLTYKRLTA